MTEGGDMIGRNVESDQNETTGDAAPEKPARPMPPLGQRFVKGQSGNPSGRPRVRGATGRPGDRLPGSDEPTRRVILEEAYRTVRVKDGDDEIEMPAHRAVIRALTEAAINGSRLAQRQWTSIVLAAEAVQKQQQVALFETLERDGVGARYSSAKREYVAIGSFDDEIISGLTGGESIVRPVTSEDEA